MGGAAIGDRHAPWDWEGRRRWRWRHGSKDSRLTAQEGDGPGVAWLLADRAASAPDAARHGLAGPRPVLSSPATRSAHTRKVNEGHRGPGRPQTAVAQSTPGPTGIAGGHAAPAGRPHGRGPHSTRRSARFAGSTSHRARYNLEDGGSREAGVTTAHGISHAGGGGDAGGLQKAARRVQHTQTHYPIDARTGLNEAMVGDIGKTSGRPAARRCSPRAGALAVDGGWMAFTFLSQLSGQAIHVGGPK